MRAPQNYAATLHAHLKAQIKDIDSLTQPYLGIFPSLNRLIRFSKLETTEFQPQHIQGVVNNCKDLLDLIDQSCALNSTGVEDLLKIKATIVLISDKANELNNALVDAVKNQTLSQDEYPIEAPRRHSTVISDLTERDDSGISLTDVTAAFSTLGQ